MMMQTTSDAEAPVVEATRQEFWTGENGLWMPPAKSTEAHEIDALFDFIMISSILLTLFVAAAMVYFIVKYRRTSHADRPQVAHESKWLEVSWIVIPTLLVMVVFFWGFKAYVDTYIPPSDAITVNVKAQKWFWSFEHQNGTNAIDELVVPVGQPIRLEMTSQDVLHSFYVPEFRIKHDVIPGRFAYVWFEAPEEGVYQVLCTEYCGTAHSNMGAKIRVVSRGDYYHYIGEGYLPWEPPPVMAPATLGATVHTANQCATCHSVDGSEGVGPSWAEIWGQPRPGSASGIVDSAYVVRSILYPQEYIVPGYENANMPSYDGLLNEEKLAGVNAYIRLLSGAATAADTTLPADPGLEDTIDGQAPEGGMGDPGVPVADPVADPGRDAVRE